MSKTHSRETKTISLKPSKKNIALAPDCRLRLPPELMCVVFQYLPTESIVSLSLTCKVFYLKYFHGTTPIPGPLEKNTEARRTRETFLGWLEKDVPELADCRFCDRLYPWRAAAQAGKSENTPCSFTSTHQDYCKTAVSRGGRGFPVGPYDPGPWPTFPLSFQTAHLAMNAVRYGPDHGPSLASFKVHRTVTDIMHRVYETTRWELKAIDDELFVHGQSTLRQLQGSAAELHRYLMDNAQRLTCRHMVMVPNLADFPDRCEGNHDNTSCRHSVFDDLRPPTFPGDTRQEPSSFFAIRKNRVRSCATCWTDFQIEIQEATAPLDTSISERLLPIVLRGEEGGRFSAYLGDHRDYIITISQWACLGPCKNLAEEVTWKTRLGSCYKYNAASHLRHLRRRTFHINSTVATRAGGVLLRWYGVPGDKSAEAVARRYEEDEDNEPLSLWAKLHYGQPTFSRRYVPLRARARVRATY
ncbi:hypothetical protein QBC37DRAFT_418981 [Rhypophila decipiens]|uniref:F-box domain-containing protein n=1 Tax=Rhypophila decipiens TaxID=261697 RepID=A0AAN6YB84_9PEZI|nr:hypothetical protein QBC37DRAFT_418981 [Rhypophila decipiens]